MSPRSRIVTINLPHDPALHRRWPFMLFSVGLGGAVCWRGQILGIGIAPRFRDGAA